MKLRNITSKTNDPQVQPDVIPSTAVCDVNGLSSSKAHPEIAELLNAGRANMIFNCPLLARDEIELANFIINKFDVDPLYLPSETLLQATRSICHKLNGLSLHPSVIRTA